MRRRGQWLESRRITRHLHRTIDRLVDTEAELRLLLDDLPEAVFSIDDDRVVRGANTKAAELTGLDHDDIAGRPLRELVDDGRRRQARRVARRGPRSTRAPSR